jgi:hypothetical protein
LSAYSTPLSPLTDPDSRARMLIMRIELYAVSTSAMRASSLFIFANRYCDIAKRAVGQSATGHGPKPALYPICRLNSAAKTR